MRRQTSWSVACVLGAVLMGAAGHGDAQAGSPQPPKGPAAVQAGAGAEAEGAPPAPVGAAAGSATPQSGPASEVPATPQAPTAAGAPDAGDALPDAATASAAGEPGTAVPPPPTFAQVPQAQAQPAQPAPPEPPAPTTPDQWADAELSAHRHDGFLIRLSIGLGYSTSESERLRYTGLGGPYSIAAGYAVVENLALIVDFFGSSMLGADIEIDGAPAQDSEIDARFSGIGLGATYYLMPLNLYVSAAFGIGWHTFDAVRGGAQVSHPGYALSTLLGKEFWVGEQWGIGAAFHFMLLRTPDDYDDALLGMGFGGLLSATYN